MGLDMYLRASEYVSRKDWSRDENGDILDTPNSLFHEIVEKLVNDIKLEIRHKPHKLIGEYKNKFECHIEPDWLLIYEVTKDLVILYRTGSHADLF